MRLKRRLKGRDELLKLAERQTRQIQELCRVGLHVGELDIAHLWCLLSWEAQYIINRDNLNYLDRSICYSREADRSTSRCSRTESARFRALRSSVF